MATQCSGKVDSKLDYVWHEKIIIYMCVLRLEAFDFYCSV